MLRTSSKNRDFHKSLPETLLKAVYGFQRPSKTPLCRRFCTLQETSNALQAGSKAVQADFKTFPQRENTLLDVARYSRLPQIVARDTSEGCIWPRTAFQSTSAVNFARSTTAPRRFKQARNQSKSTLRQFQNAKDAFGRCQDAASRDCAST